MTKRLAKQAARRMAQAVTLMTAMTARADPPEILSGGFSSTGKYERVACLTGQNGAQTPAWPQGNHWQFVVTGTFKSPAGNGSVVLRMPVLDDGEPLAVTWDGASNTPTLSIGGLPRDFPPAQNGDPATPKELEWRVILSQPNAPTQRMRLETRDGNGWTPTCFFSAALPGLQAWFEDGAVLRAGAANAEISGLETAALNIGSLLLVH